ncbi:MAG: response regulator, partial [Bacteroidota bacterium]
EFPRKVVQRIPQWNANEVVDATVWIPPVVSEKEATILVVEDHPDMRNFIKGLLAPSFKRVLLAENGQQGLEMLSQYGSDIALIISDVMMPEMDGFTMLKEIRRSPQWKGIPVIMLTALADERDKLRALTIGVDDYLAKPFSVPELRIRVQNLIYRHIQRQEGISEALSEAHVSPAQATISIDSVWLEQLESSIRGSFGEGRITVEELADQHNLSTRQLRRKLKANAGLSPTQFIREVQLQAARQELETSTNLSLGEIAFKCGFEHQASFSRGFKQRFGKSPGEYSRVYVH